MRNKNPFGRTLQEALARGREWDRRRRLEREWDRLNGINQRRRLEDIKDLDTCFPIDIVTEAQGIVDTMAEVSKPQGE